MTRGLPTYRTSDMLVDVEKLVATGVDGQANYNKEVPEKFQGVVNDDRQQMMKLGYDVA